MAWYNDILQDFEDGARAIFQSKVQAEIDRNGSGSQVNETPTQEPTTYTPVDFENPANFNVGGIELNKTVVYVTGAALAVLIAYKALR